MRSLFLLALCALTTPSAFATTILSDTADIARYAPSTLPDAKLIEISKNAPQFLEGGATYKSGLHLTADPAQDQRGTIYKAAALMSDATGRLFYRKLQILVGGQPRQVSGVAIEKDIDLKDMHFSVSTGLLDRMVVVEDAADDISLAFPLGVGGLDEGVMGEGYRLLTPRFQGASLDRANVIKARTNPAYYRGRPFMAISNSKGMRTAIAFHITILDDDVAQKYGLNYLVRGFESHGCMRMREKDLMEFFTILMNGADDKLPVNVDNHVWNRDAQGVREAQAGAADIRSVYPLNNSSYMRVTYFPDMVPHYQRDNIPNEHLVIMDRAAGQPDLSKFNNLLAPAEDELLPSGEADADLIYSKYDMP